MAGAFRLNPVTYLKLHSKATTSTNESVAKVKATLAAHCSLSHRGNVAAFLLFFFFYLHVWFLSASLFILLPHPSCSWLPDFTRWYITASRLLGFGSFTQHTLQKATFHGQLHHRPGSNTHTHRHITCVAATHTRRNSYLILLVFRSPTWSPIWATPARGRPSAPFHIWSERDPSWSRTCCFSWAQRRRGHLHGAEGKSGEIRELFVLGMCNAIMSDVN